MNNWIDSSINLGAGLLPAVEYEPANSTHYYNQNLDKLRSLRINIVKRIRPTVLDHESGRFCTILVGVKFEEDPMEYTYHWFHIWDSPNGEERLYDFFTKLEINEIRHYRDSPMKLFLEAVIYGRENVPRS